MYRLRKDILDCYIIHARSYEQLLVQYKRIEHQRWVLVGFLNKYVLQSRRYYILYLLILAFNPSNIELILFVLFVSDKLQEMFLREFRLLYICHVFY